MANEQNLKPFRKGEVSKEEAVRNGRKGGFASGIAKRQRRTHKQILDEILSFTVKDDVKQKLLETFPELKNFDGLDYKLAVNLIQLQKALKGNNKSYEIIRDTQGEKPVERVENVIDVPERVDRNLIKKWLEEDDENDE